MSALQIRGYTLSTTEAYIRDKLGNEEANRVLSELSADTRAALNSIKPAGWYPVAAIAELNWAIVQHIGKNDEERAKQVLIDCGRYMGKEATNTFLRLLMRMLTPNIFANKLPDFWKRDCNGGRFVTEVTNEKITCRLYETPGFAHVGVVATGFVSFALEAMGKQIHKTVIRDWSLAKPNEDGVGFELLWNN